MVDSSQPRRCAGAQYLFVIGAARSGTKLVRDLVAAHPATAAVPYDINYVWRLGNEHLEHDELLPEQLTESVRQRITRHLERFRGGKELLIEKTVSNSLRVPFVRAAFPEARFVQVIRDPVDVVESVYRQWHAPPKWSYIVRKASTFPVLDAFGYAQEYAYRVVAAKIGGSTRFGMWGPRYRGIHDDVERLDLLEVCAIQSLRCFQTAADDLAGLPAERVFRLRYEEFVRDPAELLCRIWAFLELEVDAVDVSSICRRVTHDRIGHGWRALDDAQRDLVQSRLGSLPERLGYAPDLVDAEPPESLPHGFGADNGVAGYRSPRQSSSVEGSILGADGVQFFWRGRVALYAILKAFGIGPGDHVIVPGFTCVAVPNAVCYTGAHPVYADIEADTYNVSRATIEPLMTPRVRAVIVQSTFGLSADLDPIIELARDAGVPVIEDCAHGLGGTYKGRPNGTVADAAFFSTQWSKPISTGLGGVAMVRNEETARRLAELARDAPPPPLRDRLLLAAQVRSRPLADYPRLYYPLVDIYRWLTQRAGLRVGSSSQEELVGTTMPRRFVQQMAPGQRRRWVRGLGKLSEAVARRRQQAAWYDDFFADTRIERPARPGYGRHAMLRYAVRVADSAATLQRARDLRAPLGNWFVSPLHPVMGDLRPWSYEPGACPESERACREVVNLLTDQPLSTSQLQALFGGEVGPRRTGCAKRRPASGPTFSRRSGCVRPGQI